MHANHKSLDLVFAIPACFSFFTSLQLFRLSSAFSAFEMQVNTNAKWSPLIVCFPNFSNSVKFYNGGRGKKLYNLVLEI